MGTIKSFLNSRYNKKYQPAKMKILSLTVMLCLACLALALPQPLARQQAGASQGQQGDKRHFLGGLYNPYGYGGYGGYGHGGYGGGYGGYGGGYGGYGHGGYGGYGYGGGYGYNQLWG